MFYFGCERKLNRLKEYDYSSDGYYYVTFCTKNRECIFGDIKNGIMGLNKFGLIAFNFWMQIPLHYKNIKLDEFVIMPNHIHGILVIDNKNNNYHHPIGNRHACSLRGNGRQYQKLPIIIGSFKSSVTREINNQYPEIGFKWQKSYYDNIIRNEKSLQNIQNYIIHNPWKWESDRNNKKNIINN